MGGPVRVLFLGAGKRLSLLEAFQRAAIAEATAVQLFSIERDRRTPISNTAEILCGPSFLDARFADFLKDAVRRHGIHLVIPNMDSATVGIAAMSVALSELGCRAVVSDSALCSAMFDKVRSAEWFRSHDIPQPGACGPPWIVKRRFGYGSRGQMILHSLAERELFFRMHAADDYLVQSFVEGPEFTIDAYVDRTGRMVEALSRRRIEVVGGEVETSETERNAGALDIARQVLSVRGWQGPITLQVIDARDAGPVIIEVNPRFGGGVTHSIHCGLDMPRWLIREHMGLPLPDGVEWKDGSLMTRCRRDIFHDH